MGANCILMCLRVTLLVLVLALDAQQLCSCFPSSVVQLNSSIYRQERSPEGGGGGIDTPSRNEDAGAGILYSLLQVAEATVEPHAGDGHRSKEEDDYLSSHEYTSSVPSQPEDRLADDYVQDLGAETQAMGHQEEDPDESTYEEEHEFTDDKPTPMSQNPVPRVAAQPQPPHRFPNTRITPTPRRLPPVRAPIFLPRQPTSDKQTTTPTLENTQPVAGANVQNRTSGHKMNTATDLDSHVAAHELEDLEPFPETASVSDSDSKPGQALDEPAVAVHHGAHSLSAESVDVRQQISHVMENKTESPSSVTEPDFYLTSNGMADLSPEPTSLAIITHEVVENTTPAREARVILSQSVQTSRSIEDAHDHATDNSGEEYSDEVEEHEAVTSVSLSSSISNTRWKSIQTSIGVSQTSSQTVVNPISNRSSAEDMTESTADSSREVTYGPGIDGTVKPELVPSEKVEVVAMTQVSVETKDENMEVSHAATPAAVNSFSSNSDASTSSELSTSTTISVSVFSSESTDDGRSPVTTEVTTPSPQTTSAIQKTTEQSVKVIFDRKTGRNITLKLATEDPEILAKMLPSSTSSHPETEPAVGKSLKTFLDRSSGKNVSISIATEDPSVLDKLLPQPRPGNTSGGILTQTIFNKATGKNISVQLQTEDPSILAAMLPPPRNISAPAEEVGVRVIVDKKTGKNITLKLITEDPHMLAMMTPPPTPGQEENNVSDGTTVTTPAVIETVLYHPGIPQQSGRLPIIMRHNVTRKPFLIVRASTKNPRPPPNFRRISDILNRSRTTTRRPQYAVRPNYQEQYPDDPEKRTSERPIEITTIRTTTTLSPYFRWGPHISVASTMKLVDGVDWSESLRDSQSTQFKDLANEVEGQLDRLFKSSSVGDKYKGVQVDSFSKGSVLVDYTLYLNNDIQGQVVQILTDAYRTGLGNDTKMGAFKVDPVYVDFKVNELRSVFATPDETEEVQFPRWAIAIIVIGAATALFLVILCLVMYCNKQAARRKYGSPLTDDVSNERKTYAIDKYAYDNAAAAPDGGEHDPGDGWNEKKPRSRNGSSSLRPNQHQRYSANLYDDGNQPPSYQTMQGYPKDAYALDASSNVPSKYYDAWNQWDSSFMNKTGTGTRKRDYDTKF